MNLAAQSFTFHSLQPGAQSPAHFHRLSSAALAAELPERKGVQCLKQIKKLVKWGKNGTLFSSSFYIAHLRLTHADIMSPIHTFKLK